MKKPNGQPFNPSERPFVLFKGNTAHSTGVHLLAQCQWDLSLGAADSPCCWPSRHLAL
jgi:hypothetical protein